MKRISFLLATLTLLAATSCKNDKKKDENNEMNTEMSAKDSTATDNAMEAQKITLTKLEGSKAYNDASLTLNAPKGEKVAAGDVKFDFSVKNYELGTQTPTDSTNLNFGLAHSDKGQHIHFIVDNEPYSAHYEPSFSKKMEQGDHVVIAFLSRSYHEAVKNPKSFVVRKFTVGTPTAEQKMDVDLKAPHMFYSRPKGTYKGADTKKVLLDFFLVNTDLSASGNKVKATINGQEFMIDQWAPYVMEGLPMGENTVKLELVDANGNMVKGPFNSVERTFMLEK